MKHPEHRTVSASRIRASVVMSTVSAIIRYTPPHAPPSAEEVVDQACVMVQEVKALLEELMG